MTNSADDDDLQPEYDFRSMRKVGRGIYYNRYHAGTNLARLDPDVRAAFPTDESVNQALRSLIPGQKPDK